MVNFKNCKDASYHSKLVLGFLTFWLAINLVQAACSGIHPDEAYYWIYSKFLDWGYFDHPPMVALFIKIGDAFGHSTLTTRLITVLTNVISIYLMWSMARGYASNPRLFIILFSSVLIFHVYAFITTPDAPLFFFTVLFLYVYQRYLAEGSWKQALCLGMLAAAMLWSKYHAGLLLLLLLSSNLKLLKQPCTQVAIFVTLILFSPHLCWQYQHGYPSIEYHLFDRHTKPYQFSFTAEYFMNQLLMMGPLTGWCFFLNAYQVNTKGDDFLRGLKFIASGTLLFFFLGTFRGRVEAHWPLIEFIPLFMLAYIHVAKQGFISPKLKTAFLVNIGLIVIARLTLLAAPESFKKLKFASTFYDYNRWAKCIHTYAKDSPVIFQDHFQTASYYNFYNCTLRGFCYDTYKYRKTQFDLWPLEDSLRHKKAYYVSCAPPDKLPYDCIHTPKGILYGRFLNAVRIYQKVEFTPTNFTKNWQAGEERVVNFNVHNPYHEAISFSNHGQAWKLKLLYGYYLNGSLAYLQPVPSDYENLVIAAKESVPLNMAIRAPRVAGVYKLFMAIQTEPFLGSRNSKMIELIVKR